MNVHWGVEKSETVKLQDVMKSYSMRQAVSSYTRVTPYTESLIDLVITNLDYDLLTAHVVGTGLSDHFAQEVVVSVPASCRVPFSWEWFRDCSSANLKLLNSLLFSEKWEDVHGNLSADEQFNCMFSSFKYYFHLACPLRKRKVRNPAKGRDKGWVTKGIMVSSKRLKELDCIRKTNDSHEQLNFYKKYRSIYFKVLKEAKSKHVIRRIQESENRMKATWDVVRLEMGKSKVKNKDISLKIGSKSIQDPLEAGCAFNTFFSSTGERMGGGKALPKPLVSDIGSKVSSSMVLFPTNAKEVNSVIQKLKNKKSSTDGISNTVLKACSSSISHILSFVINSSFNQGTFPTLLKHSVVHPIHKGGAEDDINNYRPVTLISPFSKIFESIFLQRLIVFFQRNSVLSPHQFGFTSGKSTSLAVVDLVSRVVRGLERGQRTVSVFTDMSKAFDCVEHGKLLSILFDYGVRGLVANWMESYLSGREQSVLIDGVESTRLPVRYGVPQGSVLGPVLYNVYVNGLVTAIQHNDTTLYADDVALTFCSTFPDSLEINAHVTLTSLHQYFGNLNLHTNPSKSHFIDFHLNKNNTCSNLISVLMDDAFMPETQTIKYLGLFIDSELNWKMHVNNVASKLSSSIFILRRLSRFGNQSLLKLVYFSNCESHMRYGIILWGNASKNTSKRIFTIQKRALRIIARIPKGSTCRGVFKHHSILTFPSLYILEVIMFARFSFPVVTGEHVHGYETRRRADLRSGYHRLKAAVSLPQNVGVRLHNMLPEYIKQETSIRTFKRKLKQFLIEKECYSLDEFVACQ